MVLYMAIPCYTYCQFLVSGLAYPLLLVCPLLFVVASPLATGLSAQEYVVTIDHRSVAGDVSNTFAVCDEGRSVRAVVVRDNVGAAKRWKERQGCT